MNSEISRVDFIDWKNSKCTAALLQNLDANCKMLMNSWAGGGYQNMESMETTALQNVGALGVMEAIKKTIISIQDGSFATLVDENKDA